MRAAGYFIGIVGVLLIAAWMSALALGGTDAGRRWIADEIALLSDGRIAIESLDGAVPTDFTIGHLVLSDAQGPYFEARGLEIATSPLRLLSGLVQIDRLDAQNARAIRAPVSNGTSSQNEGGLPVRIALTALEIGILEISPSLAGADAQFHVAGGGRLDDLRHMQVSLDMTRLDAPGRYHLDGRIDDRNLAIHAGAQEPAQGLLAHLAGMDSIGPVELSARSEGPRDAQHFTLALNAGPARLQAQGSIDLDRRQIALDATGSAGESHPSSDLGWRALQLEAHVHGTFDTPEAEGRLSLKALDAAGFGIDSADLQFGGNQGQIALTGRIDGLHIPGPSRDLLAASPILVSARAALNAADRPVAIELEHPLVRAAIKAKTAPDLAADLDISLPRLAPLSRLAGAPIEGAAKLVARVVRHQDQARIEGQGTLDMSGGALPAKLLGQSAHFEIAASRAGDLIRLDRAVLDGQNLRFEATAQLAARDLSAAWKLDLRDLSPLAPELSGVLHASGQAQGPLNRFKLTGDLTGTVAMRDMSSGPLTASLRLSDLPNAPAGRIEASGQMLAAPLRVAVNLSEAKTGLRIAIETAEWKSARAKGELDLPKGADFPAGRIEAAMTDLGDLAPLLGETISGRADARLETERRVLRLRAEGRQIALPAISVHRFDLDARIIDPERHPKLNGQLRIAGMKRSHLADGSALVDVDGALDALHFRIQSALRTDRGAVKIAASGTGDAARKTLEAALSLDLGATRAADLKLSGMLPSGADSPIAFACNGRLDLAAMNPILSASGEMARGRLSLALRASGTSDAPQIAGSVALENGSLEDLVVGFRVRDVQAHIIGQGEKLVIRDFTGQAKSGRISIDGSVGIFQAGIPLDLHLSADHAGLLSSDLLTATASADLNLRGRALDGLTLAGKVKVTKADINLPDRMPQQVATLDIRRPGEAPPAETQSPVRLDLAIAAPEQVFLRGQGIDAELGGTLKIAGTDAKPQITGGFDLRSGTFSIAGQELKFTRGRITLDSGPNRGIDPVLDLAAESVTSTMIVDLTVTGHADSPKITLTSSPELPQDEILAQLLFKKSTSQLSALQIAEIAEAVASLAGGGGSINPISKIRRGLGLDRLAVGSDSSGGTSVEAGKYVSKGVYIGAKEVSGTSQGQVQIDLTPSLQLQTTLGNGGVPTTATTPDDDPGSSIGLSWHLDY